MTARGTKRSAESDSAAAAPPALRNDEPLLFDALVNRADCMLNPLASQRQLMVNDVLTLVRRYTRTRLLSTVDWHEGLIVAYEIDTGMLHRPVKLCEFDGLFLPQFVAWDDGWVARTGAFKFQYFPLDNTGPRKLGVDCMSENHGCTRLCDTTGPGALVTNLPTSRNTVEFQALRNAAPETRAGSAVTISGLAMCLSNAESYISSIGESHLFLESFIDLPFSWAHHRLELVDLVSVTRSHLFASGEVPWTVPALTVQTSRPLVVEQWIGSANLPHYVVDCRQEHIVDLHPQIDDQRERPDFLRCTQVDDDTVACFGMWFTRAEIGAKFQMDFTLYDRRALRHSVVRARRGVGTSFATPIFHVSEPLNVIN